MTSSERRVEPRQEARGRPFDGLFANGHAQAEQQVFVFAIGNPDVRGDVFVGSRA